MLIILGQWGDPVLLCRDEWVANTLNKPATLRTVTPPTTDLKRLLTSMKLQIMFCLNCFYFYFFRICAAEHFSSRTRWNLMVIPNIKIKPIPEHLSPQEIRFPTFFLSAIALSILTLQAAAFLESFNLFSRFGQLRYIFSKMGLKPILLLQWGSFSLDLTWVRCSRQH